MINCFDFIIQLFEFKLDKIYKNIKPYFIMKNFLFNLFLTFSPIALTQGIETISQSNNSITESDLNDLAAELNELANELADMDMKIKALSNYVPDPNYEPKPFLKLLFEGVVTPNEVYQIQPQLGLPMIYQSNDTFISFNSFFETLNLNQFMDSTKYSLEYDLLVDGQFFSNDSADLTFFVSPKSYSESIVVREIETHRAKYFIQFYYFESSSILSGVVVVDENDIAQH